MPVQPTYPGVYIEELPSGVRTITGVSTSVAAFVGAAKRGPINQAVHVLSYADYERRFGGLDGNSEMSYAVRQFFLNGGTDSWVVRLAKNPAPATRALLTDAGQPSLTLTAREQGAAGNAIQVQVVWNSDSTFNLTLTFLNPDNANDVRVERFENLSMDVQDPRYAVDVVNSGSQLVTVALAAPAPARPRELPDHGTLESAPFSDPTPAGGLTLRLSLDGGSYEDFLIPTSSLGTLSFAAVAADLKAQVRLRKLNNPAFVNFTCIATPLSSLASQTLVLASGTRGLGSSVSVQVVDPSPYSDAATLLKLTAAAGATVTPGRTETLSGGSESPIGDSDIYNAFIGSRANRTGIYALEGVDLFNLLCLPGITDPGVLADSVAYCRERRAFLIVDSPLTSGVPPASKRPADMVTTISGTALPKSDSAAVYYPWIKIADPLKSGKLRLTAPCGTIAGLYARTDATRGVWKAPAGTEASLVGVQGVDYNLTDRENGTLNPLGVNCIRVLPVFGPISWGARTLRGADALTSEWKYVPVRRLALFLEESLFRGTQWVVFEPNDEPLWAQIRLNLGAFLHTLFRQGAFQGQTPRDAYLVKCDKETTTQDDINHGVVNILVGFAPLKPAEFVIIQIQQLAGQVQT
ncbi:MAG TPA: phage tail sheath C-terminal domain-containing protein [Thermoanaerobaculia bacterium]|nr:phage tail sheath C-terminal domain-containing protein [Thermoanaerobaculia bacterium]